MMALDFFSFFFFSSVQIIILAYTMSFGIGATKIGHFDSKTGMDSSRPRMAIENLIYPQEAGDGRLSLDVIAE